MCVSHQTDSNEDTPAVTDTPAVATPNHSVCVTWSPRILGHRQFTVTKEPCLTLSLTPTTNPTPTTPVNPPTTIAGSPNLLIVWSPRILGHHKHQFQSTDEDHYPLQQTIPLTPIHVNDVTSYLEYLSEIRENGHQLSVLSP